MGQPLWKNALKWSRGDMIWAAVTWLCTNLCTVASTALASTFWSTPITPKTSALALAASFGLFVLFVIAWLKIGSRFKSKSQSQPIYPIEHFELSVGQYKCLKWGMNGT